MSIDMMAGANHSVRVDGVDGRECEWPGEIGLEERKNASWSCGGVWEGKATAGTVFSGADGRFDMGGEGTRLVDGKSEVCSSCGLRIVQRLCCCCRGCALPVRLLGTGWCRVDC